MDDCPGAAASGIFEKHATPAEARADHKATVERIRLSILLPDRDCRIIESRGDREILALERLSMLVARTDVELIDQWNPEYMPLAFPFSITRVVGGADYPRKKRFRRHEEAAMLSVAMYTNACTTCRIEY